MAESTLSLKYDDANDATISIRQIVGRYMGVFSEDGSISTANSVKLEDAIQAGYRQAEYPAVLPNETESHSWSHLEPTTSIMVTAAVSDTLNNIPTRAAGEYIFESVTETFLSSMEGSSIKMTSRGNEFEITKFISATRVRAKGKGTVAFDVIVQSERVSSFPDIDKTNIVATEQ